MIRSVDFKKNITTAIYKLTVLDKSKFVVLHLEQWVFDFMQKYAQSSFWFFCFFSDLIHTISATWLKNSISSWIFNVSSYLILTQEKCKGVKYLQESYKHSLMLKDWG